MPVKHWLLLYEIASDYLDRRGEFRSEHLSLAWEASERGELLMGGAVGQPPESAMLIFLAENFAKSDPYVSNGLVTWRVVEWVTVAGTGAHNPVRP